MPAAILSRSFLSVPSASSAVISTLSGRRRPVAVTQLSLPQSGRDAFHRVPVLLLNIRDLVEQVPTQSLPRPRNRRPSGTRRPSPHPDLQSPRSSRRLVAVAPQRGRMTAQIESGAAWAWRVLRPSACSAGLRTLPRSLKAELQRPEPRRTPTRDQQRRDRGFHGFRG